MSRIIGYVVILSAMAGVSLSRLPHLRLAAQLVAGEIDGRRIAVTDVAAARFDEKCASIRLGDLVFEAPERARIELVAEDESAGLWLELDGLKCRILPPRYSTDRAPWEVNPPLDGDELSRQAAICSASGQDMSFWMRAADVRRLQERLKVRPVYCLAAERVELVRGKTLSGLLLTCRNHGLPRLVFTYFSPDNRLQGRAFLFPASDSEDSFRAARALVSTFGFEAAQVAHGASARD